jgi:hypothetical protein
MADQWHELNELESELRALEPKPSRIDRDRLMYTAGQSAQGTSAIPNVWMWRVAAALLLVATVVQSLRLQFVEPQIVERIAYQQPGQVESVAPASQDSGSAKKQPALAVSPPAVRTDLIVMRDSWIGQRNLALVAGIDAIAIPSSTPGDAQTSQTMGQLRDALMLRNATFSATKDDSSSEQKNQHGFDL